MFCTFATIAACFQLSGIYLDASYIHSDAIATRYYDSVTGVQLLSPLGANTNPGNLVSIQYRRDIETVSGNLGAASAGYRFEFSKRFSASLSYSYEWNDDIKENRYQAKLTWFPFAK